MRSCIDQKHAPAGAGCVQCCPQHPELVVTTGQDTKLGRLPAGNHGDAEGTLVVSFHEIMLPDQYDAVIRPTSPALAKPIRAPRSCRPTR
jgi:hypothetical protein